MIAIIDYGMGNLRSVEKGFLKVGVEAVVTNSPEVVEKADGVVLPGVDGSKRFPMEPKMVVLINSDLPRENSARKRTLRCFSESISWISSKRS